MLSKFAGSILQKDKYESVKKRELNLRERFSYFAALCLKADNLNAIYHILKQAVNQIFNSSVLHIVIKLEPSRIQIIKDNEIIEESIKVGICGDYLSRELRKKIIINNCYEDPRFNSKVDINVSNQIMLIPIIRKLDLN